MEVLGKKEKGYTTHPPTPPFFFILKLRPHICIWTGGQQSCITEENMLSKLCWPKTEQLKSKNHKHCTNCQDNFNSKTWNSIRYHFIKLLWPYKIHYCEPERTICQNGMLIILSKTSPTISNDSQLLQCYLPKNTLIHKNTRVLKINKQISNPVDKVETK